LADKLKPKWIVWENVPGVLSSNGGRDFGSFVGALGQLGYGWAMRILDAQHFGVPQRRRRVFVVACLGDWRAAAEVLSLREGLRGYLETGNKKRKGVAADAGASVEAGCWWDGGQVSQTLDAVLAKGQTMPEKNRFPAVLQPISHWEGGEVHPTLNQAHNIGSPGYSNQELFSQKGAGLVPGVQHQMPGSVAPTIGASGPPYSRTGNERVEAEALAVTTIMENSRRDAIRIYEGTSPTLQSFMGTGGCNVPMVQPAMAVRRLTPVECERLQGFPENWSRISWKGKPEEECPDGPRYKACGNSMAVPVMAFIGKRIAEVEAKGHQS
jgi:DNA (cytosine-5)-methyltransferase 1